MNRNSRILKDQVLGKWGGTQRAYLTDSPPFCYFSKNNLSYNLPSFSFLPCFWRTFSDFFYHLKWYNSRRVFTLKKGLGIINQHFFLILTFFLMIIFILWTPTLCTNLAHLLWHALPHLDFYHLFGVLLSPSLPWGAFPAFLPYIKLLCLWKSYPSMQHPFPLRPECLLL